MTDFDKEELWTPITFWKSKNGKFYFTTQIVSQDEYNTVPDDEKIRFVKYHKPTKSIQWYEPYPNSRKRQLIIELQALQSDKDHERAGSIAQDLLLSYIGDNEVTEAYNKIIKY